MTKYSFGTVIMNQGYDFDPNCLGCYGTVRDNAGPIEREEMFRCELIDVLVDERLKHERDDDDEDWS